MLEERLCSCQVLENLSWNLSLEKRYFTGWGTLVFFDTEEHQIREDGRLLATIPRLGRQWKIIHDFKPTEYLVDQTLLLDPPLSIFVDRVSDRDRDGYFIPGIVFPCTNNSTSIGLYNLSNPGYEGLESNQPPKLGEWTRIEISQEEENGKCILSFSVGGKEVGRDEVDQSGSRDITDVKIYIGTSTSPWADHTGPIQPGFIRGLVVLDKQ